MSIITLEIPESVQKQARQLAEKDGISFNQFVASAVAEKIASMMTIEYLQERAKRGNRAEFEAILAKVPDIEPEEYDRR
ncbi:MAG: toxin-antitoxin system HicB family antitoxin [Chloroflexi bacterium]|nr:toxin-antitoxin system HicB family antitoxin [Chloroflexota bacterium]